MPRNNRHRITLRAIEMFVAVAEENSVASGAQKLGASPSAVSQQISNLEKALGVKLVDRVARPVTLTPAGYIFQRRALAIMAEATRAQSELAELELTNLPQLRLAIIEDFDSDVTPELSLWLSKNLPDCNVICHAGLSHENVAALEARREDIIVATEMARPNDGVEEHPLVREPFVLVTSPGLIQPGTEPVAQLLAAPMIRYATSQMISQRIESHLRRLRLSPDRQFEFDSNAAVMAMVARAHGWAITTPFGYFSVPASRDIVELHPLPFKGFTRTLSLYAQSGVLGRLPTRIAEHLRALVAGHLIAGIENSTPWLKGKVRVLEPSEPAATPFPED